MPLNRIEMYLRTGTILLIANTFLVIALGVANIITLSRAATNRTNQIEEFRHQWHETIRVRDAAREIQTIDMNNSIDAIVGRLFQIEQRANEHSATQPTEGK